MVREAEAAVAEACRRLEAQKLPRWGQLPDLELYLDQVLELTARYLEVWPAFDRKGLTASMVNNYVMMGALPKPVKKRYSRRHLAQLLVICVLKNSLPIASIRELMAREMPLGGEEAFYDRFCACFEEAEAEAARQAMAPQEGISPALRSALLAQAEQALALRLCSVLYPGGAAPGEPQERPMTRGDPAR